MCALTLETYFFDKSISVIVSNNAEVYRRSPLLPETNGDSGAEPSGAAEILQPCFQKYAFLGIFWPKFLLKNSFFKCLTSLRSACPPPLLRY